MDVGKNKSNRKAINNTSMLLGIDSKGIEGEISRIKSLCTKFADIAYSLGETNDPEDYAKEMEESILDAYNKVGKKKRNKN